MYKFLLPIVLILFVNRTHAQIQVHKLDASNQKFYALSQEYPGNIEKNSFYFSVNNQVFTDQLSIRFKEKISGVIISNAGLIGKLDPDAAIHFKLKIEGLDEADRSILYSISGEDESDLVRKDENGNIEITNALKAPLIILFDSPVINMTIAGESILPGNIKAAINVDGFLYGDWLKPIEKTTNSNDCKSWNTTFLVDVSESVGSEDLTYIANQIDQWVKKAGTEEGGINYTYSIIPFAGGINAEELNVNAQKLSFQSIYDILTTGKNQTKVHTNWISPLRLVLAQNVQQVVFITDGIHNGTDKLHDSLTTDLAQIALLASQLRSKAEFFAIGIDKMATPASGNILQILTGKESEETITRHILLDNNQNKWWMELGADMNHCIKQSIDLNVSNKGNNALQLKWNKVKGADSYQIFRSLDGDHYNEIELKINSDHSGVYNAVDNQLSTGLYSYKIIAKGRAIDLTSSPRTGEIRGIIQLFPNPAKDFIIANIGVVNSSSEYLTVLNSLGQVLNVPVDKISPNSWMINTQNLMPGTYILQYLDKSNSITEIKKFNII